MDEARKGLPTVCRSGESLVRVWIVECKDWRPSRWNDLPEGAVAVAAASDDGMTTRTAAQWIEGFNREMLESGARLWAIAVPVVVRFEADLRPGESAAGRGVPLPSGEA